MVTKIVLNHDLLISHFKKLFYPKLKIFVYELNILNIACYSMQANKIRLAELLYALVFVLVCFCFST